MNYYVYRFLINENVVYVGKTIDIDKRMYTHFTKGHLPLECYEQIDAIQYIECKNNTDMNIKELYFINKYKPIYNTVNKSENDEVMIREFESIEWINEYKLNFSNDKINDIRKYYENIICELNVQINELKELSQKYWKEKFQILDESSRNKYLARKYKELLCSINETNINTIQAQIKCIETNPYWKERTPR